jgi:hypothetical protein
LFIVDLRVSCDLNDKKLPEAIFAVAQQRPKRVVAMDGRSQKIRPRVAALPNSDQHQ